MTPWSCCLLPEHLRDQSHIAPGKHLLFLTHCSRETPNVARACFGKPWPHLVSQGERWVKGMVHNCAICAGSLSQSHRQSTFYNYVYPSWVKTGVLGEEGEGSECLVLESTLAFHVRIQTLNTFSVQWSLHCVVGLSPDENGGKRGWRGFFFLAVSWSLLKPLLDNHLSLTSGKRTGA